MEKYQKPLSVNTLELNSQQLSDEQLRLDGGFYEGQWARLKLAEAKAPLMRIGDFATAFYPSRFKRKFVDAEHGTPLVGSRDIFSYPLLIDKYLATNNDLLDLFVESSTLLVTRSGTVGRVLLVGNYFKNHAISEDSIRVICKDTNDSGYIAAFLMSKYGQALLLTRQFGAVINHLEPEHITDLPIPVFGERVQIQGLMTRARQLRERGNCLLKKAEHLLYSLTLLSPFATLKVPLLHNEGLTVRSFAVPSNSLSGRLDASYHVPEVQAIQEALSHLSCPISPLDSVAKYISIPPRFKRIYVSVREGVRYVRPSDTTTVRILDELGISKQTKELPKLRLNAGEVLISTDGAVGNLSYCTEVMDGWAGSNNIGRIKPTEDLHPGYLLAFLQTPYGQYQLKREIFGGVIDHLEAHQIADVLIPVPSLEIQSKIGERVVRAYELRDEANALEQKAIKLLEDLIEGK